MKELYCKNREMWHEWLQKNGTTEHEIWLVFYKKGSGRPSLTYDEALDEALCFGWIDSIIKRIDNVKYVRKFNRRNAGSRWSARNKQRIAVLTEEDRITEAGYEVINAARQNGSWEKQNQRPVVDGMPEEFREALDKNEKARSYYESLASSHKKQYLLWIGTAKKKETRERRVKEALVLLEKNQQLGLR